MATSDSGDEREFGQPTRKKRKAAQAAESKFHELAGINKSPRGGIGGEDIEQSDEPSSAIGVESNRNRNGSKTESGKVVGEPSSRYEVEDEEDSGQEHEDNEEIMESDDNDDDGENFESGDDEERPSKSASTSKSRKDKSSSSSIGTEYHDFAPPPFLQKILSKRQREMDNIRRQLPVDSRSREQKLADWYRMLSKLDKPVALLSLISPPQQD